MKNKDGYNEAGTKSKKDGTDRIIFWMRQEFKDQVKAQASQLGLSMSDFFRLAAYEKMQQMQGNNNN